MKNILVIEDKEKYREDARSELAGHNVTFVSSYAAFSKEVKHTRHDVILTDLFFPAGFVGSSALEEMKSKIKPMFESYRAARFPIVERGQVYHTLEYVAKLFDMTAEQYVESEIYKSTNNIPRIHEACLDQIHRRQDYTAFTKFNSMFANMMKCDETQPHLPMGFFVAQQSVVPTCIVTDVNHHDMAFQPLRAYLLKPQTLKEVPYVDHLVNGQKPWARALESALLHRD